MAGRAGAPAVAAVVHHTLQQQSGRGSDKSVADCCSTAWVSGSGSMLSCLCNRECRHAESASYIVLFHLNYNTCGWAWLKVEQGWPYIMLHLWAGW